MSVETGFWGVGILFALLLLRVPVALSLIAVSFGGIVSLLGLQPAFGILSNTPYSFVASWTMSAVPMFLLMGFVAFHARLTEGLFDAAKALLWRVPGALAVSSIFACSGFAAVCGSSLATAASMGRIAIPEMVRAGYSPAISAGSIAAGGTIGALIPPSILMILYGTFAEASIGRLMIAGILPGILTAFIYAMMIWLRCVAQPSLAPPVDIAPTLGERMRALGQVWPMPLLIFGVIGGLYAGYVTATEAGALGAFLAILIALLYGRLNWAVMKASIVDTVTGTAVIFFVSIGAVMLSRFVALSGVPDAIVELFGAGGLQGYSVVLFCGLVFLFLGMFLDPIGLMLIALPVMLPIIDQSGFDIIWFGILTIKFVEIGLITPPVGLSVYTIKTVVGDRVALTQIFRGIGWFLLCELIVVGLLVIFPQIALFLPGLMH